MANLPSGVAWRPDDPEQAIPRHGTDNIFRPEVVETIENKVDALADDLTRLSLDISDHPELKFEERYAHDLLTSFMEKQGFEVIKHHLLDTAWMATFTHGSSTSDIRTIGINSEMDALPQVGHACGHNLIAIAGVAVAVGLKAAMERWDIPGKIVLLGTPAEEGGVGKPMLLERGAYAGMDICLMCHPAPGPFYSVSLSGSLALVRIHVEFIGHTAHAALSPWEGKNALDAAVLAYTNISLLRQQLKPTHRVHGVFTGNPEWVPNIIPDNAKMFWYIRAPTWAEVQKALVRVTDCFKAAALATACTVNIGDATGVHDLRQNHAIGEEVANIVRNRYGFVDYEWGISGASTDFGDISYVLPSLHPGFSIPTDVDGGNHTRAFTKAARTAKAHKACFNVSKALAATGMRVLTDDQFFAQVLRAFEDDKMNRG